MAKKRESDKPKIGVHEKMMMSLGAYFATEEQQASEYPYIIPFRHVGLNKITGGGFVGGKFHEISGMSGSGKSFLLYELMAETINSMGGYAFLNDGEKAFDPTYGKKVGLAGNSKKSFLLKDTQSMQEFFDLCKAFTLFIRTEKKDRKAPIILGCDSYATLKISADLQHEEAYKKDPLGYIAMRTAGEFSDRVAKFLDFLDKYEATFVLVNRLSEEKPDADQARKGMKATPRSLCEKNIQFNATQRIRGLLGKKDGSGRKIVRLVPSMNNKEETKQEIGMWTNWRTIKNRVMSPFKTAECRVIYTEGLMPLSGLAEILVNERDITQGHRTYKKDEKDKDGEKWIVFRVNSTGKIYKLSKTIAGKTDKVVEDVTKLIVADHPELINPKDDLSFDDAEAIRDDETPTQE